MAQKEAQQKAASRGSKADRDFALSAQETAPWEEDPDQTPSEEETATATAAVPTLTWEQRKLRARQQAMASRANTNALTYLQEHADEETGECTVWVHALAVVEMGGGKYEFNKKAVAFAATLKGETPTLVLDFYGMAGVNSIAALATELGDGPWPEPLPCSIGEAETENGVRAILAPMW